MLLRAAYLLFFFGVLVQTSWAQSGCTDPDACNYDAASTIDDGSCCFNQCLTVTISNSNGGTNTWELRDQYGVLRASHNQPVACIPNAGCLQLTMLDGSAGGTLNVYVNGEVVLSDDTGSSFLFEVSYGPFQAEYTVGDCSGNEMCAIPAATNYLADTIWGIGSCTFNGCTDPAACNFNPTADGDDGSCTYTTECGQTCTDATGRSIGFQGVLAAEQWNESTTAVGTGVVYPGHAVIAGLNNGQQGPIHETALFTTAPVSGTYSFDWHFYPNFLLDKLYVLGSDTTVIALGSNGDQSGTVDVYAAVGERIGFLVEHANSSVSPAYAVIQRPKTPTLSCGCTIAEATNYAPLAIDGNLDDCEWPVYGCSDPLACTYSPGATQDLTPTEAQSIAAQLESQMMSGLNALGFDDGMAYLNEVLGFSPCLYPDDTGIVGCQCLLEWNTYLPGSEADIDLSVAAYETFSYLGAPPSTFTTANAPYACQETAAYAVSNSIAGTNVYLDYPCGTQTAMVTGQDMDASSIVFVVLPPTTENLVLMGDIVGVIQLMKGGGTAPQIQDMTDAGATSFELPFSDAELATFGITAIPCTSCHEPAACNYDPTGIPGGTCEFPSGCSDPAAANFSLPVFCGGTCVYRNPCGQLGDPETGTFFGFNGDFAPALWNILPAGDGTVDVSESLLDIVGNNNGTDGLITGTALTVPTAGTYQFNWSFSTSDVSNNQDTPEMWTPEGWIPLIPMGQTKTADGGRIEVVLEVDDQLAFRVNSHVGSNGAGRLRIYDFGHPGSSQCIGGCSYPDATNYTSIVDYDDGSCLFEAVNTCPIDLDGDGTVSTNDLLIVIGSFGSACL